MPCYKLGIRFDDPLMVKRFLDSRRSGFYFSVAVEGDIGVGDSIEVLARNEARISIPEILRLYIGDEVDPVRLQQAIELPALSDAWRGDLRKRLAGST
jgi:MOSC domain-containing protein YiiM